jgi:hypothetical protein
LTTYKSTIDVNASPEAVFAYVSDLSRHHEWAAQPLVIETSAAGPPAAGTKARSKAHQFGRDNANELVVTEIDPPRRFAFEAFGREGRFIHSFDLRPVDGGTRLTKTFDVLEVNFFIRMLMPVFAVLAPRSLTRDLSRIKSRLEGQRSP